MTLSDDLCIIAAAAHLDTNIQFQFMAPLFMSNFLFVLINLIDGSVAGGVMFLLLLRFSAVVERRKHKKREI